MEGWQAQPDGVVLCPLAQALFIHRRQPPPAYGVPLHGRGIGNGGVCNWQALRGNAGKDVAKRKAINQTQTQTHFWYFLCVLCESSAPSAFDSRTRPRPRIQARCSSMASP